MRLVGVGIISFLLVGIVIGTLVVTSSDAQAAPVEEPFEPARWPDLALARAMASRPPSAHAARSGVITADVPILMYHHVGAPYRNQFNVSLQDFEAQMAYLAQNGYTSVSVGQIAAALRGQASLPPCPVAITFDDGYADNYENAVPVLSRYGFRATFYLVTSYVSTTKMFLNWTQVRDLAGRGMEIGSHSYTHAAINQLSGYTLTHQIAGSKARLEAGLGVSITTFAYPYGGYNGLAMQVLSQTGYTSAVGIGYLARQSSNAIYNLNRTAVYDGTPLSVFISRLPKYGPDGRNRCPLVRAARRWAPRGKSVLEEGS